MGKSRSEDRVLNEARKRAIEKAYIPQSIKKSYNVTITDGTAILSKKKK